VGGNVALNFGIAHPDMSESLMICGCGSGTVGRESFLAEGEKRAQESWAALSGFPHSARSIQMSARGLSL
jgi:hypothetical protein